MFWQWVSTSCLYSWDWNITGILATQPTTPCESAVLQGMEVRGGSRANVKGGQLMMGVLTNFPNFAIRVLTIILLHMIISDPTDGISPTCLLRRAFRAIVLTGMICNLRITKNSYNINHKHAKPTISTGCQREYNVAKHGLYVLIPTISFAR